MICTRCGAEFPDDKMICPICGAEVQIVPDYNPLDDVLAQEVKGSVEGATRRIQTDGVRRYRRTAMTQNVNSTRILRPEEMDRIRDGRQTGTRRQTGQTQQTRRNTGEVKRARQDTAELRRQRKQKRLEAAKRKRRNLLITLFVILAVIVAGIIVVYQNSYTSMINKGYREIQSRDYTAAENYFKRAIVKDESRPEAYTGYAKLYTDQNDMESAENVFLSAIESQPTNAQLYQAAIDFYMEVEQPEKVSALLNNCEDAGVLKAVEKYISAAPVFSLEEGTYEEVQEVAITSETGGEIYYTTDGTDPTVSTGTRYTEPVLLQEEGDTEIRAIAVNESGIPSVVSSAEYTIEFPIENAPIVNPPTGQYTEPTQITITVPEGYTAYYTLDGTTPDPSSSSTEKYTGPVDMPENAQTIFNAILVNDQNGKATDMTTRNYITTE